MKWIRRFAAWAPADVGDERSILTGYVTAANRLDLVLTAEGAEALGPVTFEAAERVPWADEGPGLCLRAEVEAIILRHPNPFPEIRLFSWPWARR